MTTPDNTDDEPLDPATDGPVGGGYTGGVRDLLPPPPPDDDEDE
ncbi:hypothetical protein [Amycolatopsis albispora]|nr:hypothetical protein [Amycolatopsis albispora]